VLDAVAREDGTAAVVELDGNSDDQRALGYAQPVCDRVADVGVLDRLLELGECRIEERVFPLQRRVRRNLLQTSHARSVSERRLAIPAGRGD
jgi:hypothetical protein